MHGNWDQWQVIAGAGVIALAALFTAGLILVLQPLLRSYAMARPTARSSHTIPTPQGGGIAILLAVLAVTALAASIAILTDTAFRIDRPLGIVLAAAIFLGIVGAVDDIRPIAVAPRLSMQTIAVVAMLTALPDDLRIVPQIPWWLERGLMLLAGVWFVNLTNFMDGIDWISVAEVVPVTGGLIVIGLFGALPLPAIVVALALCGAMIGFAPINRPVARLFMGDVGSLPIGLLLCWLLILLAGAGHLAAAVLLPLYYLGDATITLARRIARREPFWQAHRGHFYQRATDAGWSVRETVARIFVVNLGLVALAIATVLMPRPEVTAICLLFGAVLVGGLLWTLTRRPGGGVR